MAVRKMSNPRATPGLSLLAATAFTCVAGSTAGGPRPTLVIEAPKATICVDVSHDGRLVAAEGDNCKALVWDARSGKRLFTLDEGKYFLCEVRFTDGGRTLVTSAMFKAALDHFIGRLTWWDLKTGKPRKRLDFPRAPRALVLSPDGKTLATGSGKPSDESIHFYDAATGRHRGSIGNREFWGHLAFTPDGKSLAISSWRRPKSSVDVWDFARKKIALTIDREGGINAIAFANDGCTLACSTGNEGVVLSWMGNGKAFARSPEADRPLSPRDMLFACKGRWILGYNGRGICVFDGATARRLRRWVDTRSTEGTFTLSRDGKTLATVGEDLDEVKIWRVDQWKIDEWELP